MERTREDDVIYQCLCGQGGTFFIHRAVELKMVPYNGWFKPQVNGRHVLEWGSYKSEGAAVGQVKQIAKKTSGWPDAPYDWYVTRSGQLYLATKTR